MSKQAAEESATAADVHSLQSKIRVGIVGCGEVTQIMHKPSLHQLGDGFEVTALCDVSPVVLGQLGELWNVRNLMSDYRELVTHPDVDAVLVANPNVFHAEVTLDAVAAGKHVLVEKPMCMTRGEADQIIAAQAARDVVVQVGYMRRYAPAFLEACDAVRRLGEIKFARVRDFIGLNSLIINSTSRVIRDEQLPEALKSEADLRERTRLDEALGKDSSPALRRAYSLMLGLSSHDLSAMRELLGMPNRVLFAAERSNGQYLAAAFDYGTYLCQFETGVDRIARFDAHLEVYGTERVIRVQYDTPYVRNLPIRLMVTEAKAQAGVVVAESHPTWGDPFVEEWKAFHDCITNKRTPKTGPVDFRQDLDLFAEMVRLIRSQ